MDDNSLRDHAAKLHAELTAAVQANPESKDSLSGTMQDVHRLLDESESPTPHASLPDRLEGIAVQFEADHPTLAASARRLIDLLAEVGI
jgi:hypothetical protein